MTTSRVVVAACMLAASLPAQIVVQEFLIPRANAFPHDPAVGADGIVWYTDQNNSYIGRLDPTTGTITDRPTPTPGSGPHGICVAPDGSIWYTAQSVGRLGRVDPAGFTITEFVLPANANRPHTPIFHRGAVWFTAQTNDTYARLDPANGQTTVWPAPAGSRPYGIVPAPDGSLWIALFGTNTLGRVDTNSGALSLFDLPSSAARPRRLAVANDGIVWFSDYARDYLGRLDPTTRAYREWVVPDPPPGAYGIATGTDSRVWFHAAGSNYMIAFDPRSEQFSTVPIPTGGAIVRHMVCDQMRGDLWLALSGTRRIGRIALGAPVGRVGAACSGAAGTPEITVDGVPRIGETVGIGVRGTTAPASALLFGFSDRRWNGLDLPYDLVGFGARSCFVNSSWEIDAYSGAPGVVPVTVPVDPGLGALVLFAQWALLGDPSGSPVVTTQAVRLTLIGL